MSKVVCPDCGSNIVACRRYPLEAFAEFMDITIPAACRMLSITGSTEKGPRCHGLTRQKADKAAALVREHTATIWPEVVDHDIEDTLVECEKPGCTTRFVPSRKGHRFCSKSCNMWNARANERKAKRERYATDPEYRARRRAEADAYWRANAKARRIKEAARRRNNGDHIRARVRRWYAENRDEVNARRRENAARKRDEAA